MKPATRLAGVVAVAAVVLLGFLAAPARAQIPSAAEPGEPPARYFYFGRDYGSQAIFSPLSVFLNRGFDVLQDHIAPRNIFSFDYRTNTGNVLHNVAHPVPAIRQDGWGKFLREEIFPLSYRPATARWTPNYSLHLIGGGVTYRSLQEWFEDAHAPAPRVLAAATVMASALVNESLENHGVVGFNTDCLADLYVFDVAGIILFSFDGPSRFFSRQIVISDWSLQPSFTAPNGQLHNVGNYFSAKWALPFYPRLSLFSWFGEATTGGLSFRLNDGYAISGVAGGAAIHLTNASMTAVANMVTFVPTAALFLDRNNSLLASVQVTDNADDLVHVNVYPHAFTSRGPTIGAWAVVDKHARVAAGVAIGSPLGVGVGWSSL